MVICSGEFARLARCTFAPAILFFFYDGDGGEGERIRYCLRDSWISDFEEISVFC